MADKSKKITITRNDLNKVLPPIDKEEAIANAEKYTEEFELSRQRVNKIFEEFQKMYRDVEK